MMFRQKKYEKRQLGCHDVEMKNATVVLKYEKRHLGCDDDEMKNTTVGLRQRHGGSE